MYVLWWVYVCAMRTSWVVCARGLLRGSCVGRVLAATALWQLTPPLARHANLSPDMASHLPQASLEAAVLVS